MSRPRNHINSIRVFRTLHIVWKTHPLLAGLFPEHW